MNDDIITLSSKAAEGISLALGQDFNRVETPERMAWIVWLLECLPDNEKHFPLGKWATIQSIKSQLEKAANQSLENDTLSKPSQSA